MASNPLVGLLFFIFFLWLLYPEGNYSSQSLTTSELAVERLKRFHDALDVLNQTSWADFTPQLSGSNDVEPKYLNLSGFREEDHYAWEDLGRFRERSLEYSRYAMLSADGQNLWDNAAADPVWMNVSGTVHGEWVRRKGSVSRTYESYNLSHSAPSMGWIGDKVEWARNMTGDSGRMMVRIDSNKTTTDYEQLPLTDNPVGGGIIRNVKATVTFEDTVGSGHNWEMRFWGVHWPRQGVVLLTTTSEKFEGIFGLPHLAPSEDFFQSSQKLLNQTLGQTIATKEDNIYVDQVMPWSSDLENPLYTMNPSPHCELIMYMQVHPPGRQFIDAADIDSGSMTSVIGAIESELGSPQGAPIPSVPKLQMSTIVYSPDCAFFLESKGPPDFPPGESHHLMGVKTEVHLHQIRTCLILFALIVYGQLVLLKNQIKESYTPSTMSRISFWTISAMVIADGSTFICASTWVSSATATFLPTLALAFSSCLSATVGGRFLKKLFELQLPESRSRQERDPASSNSSNPASSAEPVAANSNTNSTDTGSLLPAPVTASQSPGAQPMIVPSDQDIDAEIAENAVNGAAAINTTAARPENAASQNVNTFQSIIGRYLLGSLCLIFLGISSITWYARLRSLFLNVCTFAYLSLWVPQIYRNTMRNCRRAFSWQFVIGQSVLRILPIAYFWLKESNFLFAIPEPHTFYAFVGWVWLQLVILGAQDLVGPRFGVPDGWAPDAWDYHPVLREDSLEAGGLPIGLVADDTPGIERARSGEDRGKRKSSVRTIDCAICRELLEVHVLTAEDDDQGMAGMLARRQYMVTPCRHIFHSECLEGWMRFRLQCPICREELPPL